MNTLAAKLKHSRGLLKLTQAEAAQASGLEQRDVSRLETGKAKTPPLAYMQFLHSAGINLNWLLGEDDAAAPLAGPVAATGLVAPPPEIIVATPDVAGNRTIPIVNRKAAANYLTGYQTQEYFEELDVMTLPPYLLRGGQGLIIQAVNDSMEDTIFEGDYLVCRLVERGNWADIKNFSVCVVVSESRGIQVKRVKNRLRTDGLLRLSSDNRQHHSFNVFADDIHQIWQVVLLLTANLPNRADGLYHKLDALEDTTTDLRELCEQLQARLHTLDGQ